MPRDLTKDRHAHQVMAEALKNAPRLGKYTTPSKKAAAENRKLLLISIAGGTIAGLLTLALLLYIRNL